MEHKIEGGKARDKAGQVEIDPGVLLRQTEAKDILRVLNRGLRGEK